MKDETKVVRFKKGNVYLIETKNSDKNGLYVVFERFCSEDDAVCTVLRDHGRYLKNQRVLVQRLEMKNAETED